MEQRYSNSEHYSIIEMRNNAVHVVRSMIQEADDLNAPLRMAYHVSLNIRDLDTHTNSATYLFPCIAQYTHDALP